MTEIQSRIHAFAKLLYERRLTDDYDAIIPVVADEGDGKSTWMLQYAWYHQMVRGRDPSVESVLKQIVWDNRTEFKTALVSSDTYAAVPVMDAARVLHKKEAMDPDQIEAEKDLLDVRFENFAILLGYQEYDVIPKILQKRRAEYAIRLPERGIWEAYDRDALDEVWENNGDWDTAAPKIRAQFPSLEGTVLWDEFVRHDNEHKRERMGPDDEEDGEQPASVDAKELAEVVKEDGVENVTSLHGAHKEWYIDPDLIEVEYGVTQKVARLTKKVLAKDDGVVVGDKEKSEKKESAPI